MSERQNTSGTYAGCDTITDYASGTDKIQLESKDDLKARGLPSPDLGDALALTFAFPVYRSESVMARARAMGLPTLDENPLDYDPYRNL